RTLAYLLGGEQPDERLRGVAVRVTDTPPAPPLPIDAIREAFTEPPLIYFRGLPELGQFEAAAELGADAEIPLLKIDVRALAQLDYVPEGAARITVREGIFEGAALLIDHWDALLESERRPLLAALWERLAAYPLPVFLCGEHDWEPPEPLN